MKNNIYDFYIKKYDLESLDIDISDKQIVFLIYDENYYYYLNNNCFLETNEDFNVLKKIAELKRKYRLEITNFYPVCLCKETLVMAFKVNNGNKTGLQIVKYDEIGPKYYELIQYHKKNYSMLFVSSNVKKEIFMSQKYIKRYEFHEKYIKRYILTEKQRRKKEFIELLDKLIPAAHSIIDVSCGDNSDIFKIAKKKNYTTIVGNDICLNYLKTHESSDIICTNDDIELNRIKNNSYDVSFCKNTLHHMNNLTNINKILNFLDKISKDIVIMEIANPKEYKGLPKFLNKYLYTKFLRDVGTSYLDEEQFKNILTAKFKNHDIEYQTFTNILGTYMIAKITKKEVSDENKSRN